MPAAKKSSMHRYNDTQRDAKLVQVAALYLAGKSQSEIGAELGHGQQMISYYLRKMQAEWRTQYSADVATIMTAQLARIDLIEATAWEEYERSQANAQRRVTTTSKEPVGSGEDGGTRTTTRTQLHTEGRLGDPRYLERISWCVEQRIKICGGYAPTKGELSGPDGAALLTVQVVYADVNVDPAPPA